MSFIIGHHYNDHSAVYGGSQNTVSLLKTTIEVGEINSDKWRLIDFRILNKNF